MTEQRLAETSGISLKTLDAPNTCILGQFEYLMFFYQLFPYLKVALTPAN